jgi:hypothetical protein
LLLSNLSLVFKKPGHQSLSQNMEACISKDLEDTHSSQPLYIDANGHQITNENFAIGPSTARETLDSGRAAIDFDRGPYKC